MIKRLTLSLLLFFTSVFFYVFLFSGCSVTRDFSATATAKGAKIFAKGDLKEGDVLLKSRIKVDFLKF